MLGIAMTLRDNPTKATVKPQWPLKITTVKKQQSKKNPAIQTQQTYNHLTAITLCKSM